MKNTQLITAVAKVQYNPELEKIILKKDADIKELARKNAKHFAKKNLPGAEEETLAPYTGEIKTGYEQLASEILHFLQPANHFPEAKMDADFFKEKDKQLDIAIKGKEDKNQHDEYELSNYNPGSIPLRVWVAGIATFIISIGEVIFNTKSFQVTGENLLFALLLSFSVSFAVFVASHIAAFLYKSAKTKGRKILIVVSSLLLVTGVFTALAIFRSRYLESHEVHINPTYFVLINLFFFIVSALLSFMILPTWQEIKENLRFIKLLREVKRRKKEIKEIRDEKEDIKAKILENTKYRLRIIQYGNYATERIRKMYFETVEIFKGTNLVFRNDKETPLCFKKVLPEPDIEGIILTFTSPNNKAQ